MGYLASILPGKHKKPINGNKLDKYAPLKIAKHVALSVGLFAVALPASATVITYTSQTAWETALAGATTTTETFDGAASSFTENSVGNLIGSGLTLDMLGGVGDPGPTGLTGVGQLQFEVDSSSTTTGDGLAILINGPQIIGFALHDLTDDSATSPEVNLHELGILVAGSSFLISDILGLTTAPDDNSIDAQAPFVGFISTVAFDTFTFVHGDDIRPVSGGNESFWLEGLTTAQATSVPEPASLALLGLGLAGIGLSKRKKA